MPRKKTEVKFKEQNIRIEIHVGEVLKGYLWATKFGVCWQPARAKHPLEKSWKEFDEWMRSES
jgi:NOL1/NOP2/fmu family ribosome biogenesis protein